MNRYKENKIIEILPIAIIILVLIFGIWWFIKVRIGSCKRMVEQNIYKSTYICLIDRNS